MGKKEFQIVLARYKVVICCAIMMIMLGLDAPHKTAFIRHKMDFYVSILVIIFGCDLMYQELFGEMKDVFRKFGAKQNFYISLKRLGVQWLFFLGVSSVFFWESYLRVEEKAGSVLAFYGKVLYSTGVTIVFFSVFVTFMMLLTKSQYSGMGISIIIWVVLTSPLGEKIGPIWNPIWTSQKADKISDIPWIQGKLVAILISVILLAGICYLCHHLREGVKEATSL
ncbi:MAG: hypothetical protein K2J67_11380 [Lachnospiraceae bacterium]|nr:hypothetical protein [Lachnospiraceae bacterium]